MTRLGATQAQRLLIETCLTNGVPFSWRGPGTLLIEKSGLVSILPMIIAEGANILGFEGFEMESTDIHPRLDLIFDASLRPDLPDPSTVISDWPPDIWVDVALGMHGVIR